MISEILPPIEQDRKEYDDDDDGVWVLRVAPRHTEDDIIITSNFFITKGSYPEGHIVTQRGI